ncbi:hypothetical protein BDU57DRAFT_514343 [Ampelomyces quisqualis]|uniref:SWIM-type domain-containing protein n=1 Tax=Ampelomyces quisqualis TaxID=50730 RepID=A0A6A5QR76_AMPQU|nr:hypothetical protein BDU57DRAFT_514343 [Ampelomyces quisqualis]
MPLRKVPADVINTTSHSHTSHVAQSASIAMSLPTPRLFITQLLGSLPSSPSQSGDSRNPLSAVPETARKQLLSLQVLFPNEFLPALDLLDRRLVTRLATSDGGGETNNAEKDAIMAHAPNNNNHPINEPATQPSAALDTCTSVENTFIPSTPPPDADTAPTTSLNALFYVRSAQQRPSRYSTSYDSTTSYQVRLRAWNCSCPAFAFAAFAAVHPEPAMPVHDGNASPAEDKTRDNACVFGGVSLGETVPPVCKHLLACVLVEKCGGLFGAFVEERVVGVEEAAGWAAGWGDS